MPKSEDSSDLAASGRFGRQTTPFSLMYRLERNLRPFRSENVRNLPSDRAGVYAIWLPTGSTDAPECLYVGISTTCIKTRLLAHIYNETNPDLRTDLRMFRDIVLFSTAFTSGDSKTLEQLETSVIQKWQPKTNRNKLGGDAYPSRRRGRTTPGLPGPARAFRARRAATTMRGPR